MSGSDTSPDPCSDGPDAYPASDRLGGDDRAIGERMRAKREDPPKWKRELLREIDRLARQPGVLTIFREHIRAVATALHDAPPDSRGSNWKDFFGSGAALTLPEKFYLLAAFHNVFAEAERMSPIMEWNIDETKRKYWKPAEWGYAVRYADYGGQCADRSEKELQPAVLRRYFKEVTAAGQGESDSARSTTGTPSEPVSHGGLHSRCDSMSGKSHHRRPPSALPADGAPPLTPAEELLCLGVSGEFVCAELLAKCSDKTERLYLIAEHRVESAFKLLACQGQIEPAQAGLLRLSQWCAAADGISPALLKSAVGVLGPRFVEIHGVCKPSAVEAALARGRGIHDWCCVECLTRVNPGSTRKECLSAVPPPGKITDAFILGLVTKDVARKIAELSLVGPTWPETQRLVALLQVEQKKLREAEQKQGTAREGAAGGETTDSEVTGGLSKEHSALTMLMKHPDWTHTRIAEAGGCARTSLYRWRNFRKACAALREGRAALPRGSKDADGNVEAWDE